MIEYRLTYRRVAGKSDDGTLSKMYDPASQPDRLSCFGNTREEGFEVYLASLLAQPAISG